MTPADRTTLLRSLLHPVAQLRPVVQTRGELVAATDAEPRAVA